MEFVAGPGAPQAVGADFHKPFGQDVPQEAPDEFLGGNGHVSGLLGAVVAIAESDLSVGEGLESAIADGGAKDVTTQVIEHLESGASVLTMHDPVLLPDTSRGVVEEAQFFEAGFEFALEDFAQGKAGDKEGGVLGMDPVLAIGGKSPGGDQQMSVGMVRSSEIQNLSRNIATL